MTINGKQPISGRDSLAKKAHTAIFVLHNPDKIKSGSVYREFTCAL